MSEVLEYIKRSSKRIGCNRDYYIENNVPTVHSNVLILPFFGDLKSTVVLSSFILKSWKERNPDKYIILCSWPEMKSLFPYVDEYWSPVDENILENLSAGADGFSNKSKSYLEITRGASEILNIMTYLDLQEFYNEQGFTKKFMSLSEEMNMFKPNVPLVHSYWLNKSNDNSIIVYPCSKMKSWQNGKVEKLASSFDFWKFLIERLLTNGLNPVVFQNRFTYDMSKVFAERCNYISNKPIVEVMSEFRNAGMVLDIHSDISKLAILARCPYLSVTERQIFIDGKDYEFDDLGSIGLPRKYIFSFSTQLIVGSESQWDASLVECLIKNIKNFKSDIKNFDMPSPIEECQSVPYSVVRQRKNKRLGLSFIKKSKRI